MTTKPNTRIYAVAPNQAGEPLRLVRAIHAAQALRHVASDTLTVRVASQDDLISAIAAGAKVEEPRAEAPEAV